MRGGTQEGWGRADPFWGACHQVVPPVLEGVPPALSCGAVLALLRGGAVPGLVFGLCSFLSLIFQARGGDGPASPGTRKAGLGSPHLSSEAGPAASSGAGAGVGWWWCYRDWAGPRSSPCPPPPWGDTIRGWGVAAPALCHADSTGRGGTLVLAPVERGCWGWGGHPWSLGRDTPPLLSPCSVLQGASAMAEKLSPSPGGAITPLQQMLASGTGAILTSLFGEEPGQRVGAAGRGGGAGVAKGRCCFSDAAGCGEDPAAGAEDPLLQR